ncbi:MAG: hypothetical protein J0I98_06645 [Mesorhizobium sp.]|nr:hypothetical protein [Mesorhizobium sp.]MBN9242453.1 hypothetical protein [Mesorhizobium sp.]
MTFRTFRVGDIVEKVGGRARFWGEVVALYQIEPGEWRADVKAIHPEFLNLVHIYDTRQIRLRAPLQPERTQP